MPSNSNGPFCSTASTEANSSSSTTPIRPIPESTAICTFNGVSFKYCTASFSHATESTLAVILFSARSAASSTRLSPRIKIGCVNPASRNPSPSSTFATQNPVAPASTAAFATGIIPCPYALAFTTAYNSWEGLNFSFCFLIFCFTIDKSTTTRVLRWMASNIIGSFLFIRWILIRRRHTHHDWYA